MTDPEHTGDVDAGRAEASTGPPEDPLERLAGLLVTHRLPTGINEIQRQATEAHECGSAPNCASHLAFRSPTAPTGNGRKPRSGSGGLLVRVQSGEPTFGP
jgi:hypothetical protein